MARVGDLEIDEAIGFQRRQWVIQRIGWVVMAVIIVLGALGLFGTGVLSSATAGDPDGSISIGYERFARREGRASLDVRIDPDQATDGQLRLWIDASYLSAVDLEQVNPEPAEVQTRGDRLIFTFAVAESTAPHEISFSMRPQEMGRIEGEAGIVDGASVSFWQIVYP